MKFMKSENVAVPQWGAELYGTAFKQDHGCCTSVVRTQQQLFLTSQTKIISTSIFFLLPLTSHGEMTPLRFHFASSSGSCLPFLGYPFLYTHSYIVRGVWFFLFVFFLCFLPSITRH